MSTQTQNTENQRLTTSEEIKSATDEQLKKASFDMLGSRADIVISSHLSDIRDGVNMNIPTETAERIELRTDFIKFIIYMTEGDLTMWINPSAMFELFKRLR